MPDSYGNNKYTFTWEIKKITHEMLISFDSNEIRSPLFCTKNIGGASWYLAIRMVRYTNECLCYLVRDYVDDGSDIVKIQYTLNVAGNHSSEDDNRKMISEIGVFKKGDSCLRCKFQIYNRSDPVTLQCNMVDFTSVKSPLSKGSKVETKAENFIWRPVSIRDENIFSGPHGTKFKMKFFKDQLLNNCVYLDISRYDNENVKCYLMYSSLFYNGVFMHAKSEESRWSKPFGINHEYYRIETNLSPTDNTFKTGLYFKIWIVTSVLKDSEISVSAEKPTAHSNTNGIFSCDLLRMYENKMHTDVKLKTGNHTFFAHKCILSCRSPVFAAMFNQKDMTETQHGEVEISDMDDGTLNLLLEYVYKNDIEKLNDESALKLLMAADKYQMLSLKDKCSNYLLGHLSEENVCDILVAADMISDQNLKSSVMNCVKALAHKILISDSWKQLVGTNSNLVAETLSEISKDFGEILMNYNARKDHKE